MCACLLAISSFAPCEAANDRQHCHVVGNNASEQHSHVDQDAASSMLECCVLLLHARINDGPTLQCLKLVCRS